MHLVIRNIYLKKIKNLISVAFTISKKISEDFLVKVNKNELVIYIPSNFFWIKVVLKTNENLVVKKTGEVILNLSFFKSLIDSLEKDNDLEIYKAENNHLQFFSGKFSGNLNLSVNEKITMKEVNDVKEYKVKIPYSVLKTSFNKLKDFCKNPESNISKNTILTNIHFENTDSNLEVWASDSYRAVLGRFPNLSSKKEFQMNIQPVMLNAILGLFNEYQNEEIDIYYEGDKYMFVKNEYVFVARLDVSKYPDFSKWFNETKSIEFSVNKENLLCAIKRNILFFEKDIKTAIYRLEEEKLFIEYKNSDKGFCKEVLDVEYFDKEKIEFCLNNFFLEQLVKNIDSEKIVFSVYDSLRPIILLPENNKEEFKQFISPLRHAS